MKKLIILITLIITAKQTFAQIADSLLAVLKAATEDTAIVNTLNALSNVLKRSNPDTALYFANEAFALAEKLKDKRVLPMLVFRRHWP